MDKDEQLVKDKYGDKIKKGKDEMNIKIKNIARIANAVPITLYSRVTVNVEIVVLNCQKCEQCLKGHKFLGLFFEGVLHLSLSFSLYLSLSLSFCWSCLVSSCISLILIKRCSKTISLCTECLPFYVFFHILQKHQIHMCTTNEIY